MLQKSQRLTRTEFSHFFKIGQRSHSPSLTLLYTPHKEFHGAVVVSKKVAKRANVRNELRRRIYGQLYTKVKESPAGVFIVIVKPPFALLSKNEQKESVQKLLTRITMSSTT